MVRSLTSARAGFVRFNVSNIPVYHTLVAYLTRRATVHMIGAIVHVTHSLVDHKLHLKGSHN